MVMRRRQFFGFVGAASVWPLVARAQQGERTRRIGIIGGAAADNPDAQAQQAAFLQGLQQLGWIDGRNAHRIPLDRRESGQSASIRGGTDCAWA
jgi:putative tryptophan/tyrosine transport system substrate-binding protein